MSEIQLLVSCQGRVRCDDGDDVQQFVLRQRNSGQSVQNVHVRRRRFRFIHFDDCVHFHYFFLSTTIIFLFSKK